MSSTYRITIASNAVTAKLMTDDKQVKDIVNNCLTYFVDGYENNSLYQNHSWDGKASMFNYRQGTFPAGLKFFVTANLKQKGYEVSFHSKPLPEPKGKMRPKIGNYEEDPRYEYQYTCTEKLLKYGQMIMRGATGCHAKGTKILMYDGTFKNVEDIRKGDLLMGVDSTPRTVMHLVRGEDELYEISPLRGGKPFVVNGDHILSLQQTNVGTTSRSRKLIAENGKWHEVTVNDYLSKWTKTQKHIHKLHRSVGISFPEQENTPLPLDPYLLGLLLGDGSLGASISITTPDIEIINYLNKWAKENDLCICSSFSDGSLGISINITAYTKGQGQKKNKLKTILSELELQGTKSDTKFIPQIFKTSTRENRLKLLAGLMDTDGHLAHNDFDYISKSKQLAEDVAFLARSVGLSVSPSVKRINTGAYKGNIYYRLHICGHTEIIPTQIERKKATPRQQKKNPNLTGFKITPIGEGEYFGFQLDKDHLYMLEDFTITHNCGKTRIAEIAFATIKRPTLFITSRQILMYQMKERIENDLGIDVSVLGDGNFGFEGKDGRHYLKLFTVATVQTIVSHLKNAKTKERMKSILEKFEFVILEEAHESSADGWFEVLKLCKNAYYRLALTATPFMKSSEEANMRLSASSGPIGITVTEKQLIDSGILAKPYFKFVHLRERPKHLANNTYWQAAYRLGIVENEERNQAVVREAQRAVSHGLTVMVLFQQINHGKILKSLFDAVGIPNNLLIGENDQEERKKAIERLKNGQIKVLLGSTILDVGVDVPAVGMIILASGGKAEVATRQRIGRGLRAKKDKANICFIVDFDDPFNKYTKRHAIQRYNIIKFTPGFGENIVLDFNYDLLKE